MHRKMQRTGARIIPTLMPMCAIRCSTPNWSADAFGIWRAKSLTVRIEPHVKGEVFTMDTIHGDGRRKLIRRRHGKDQFCSSTLSLGTTRSRHNRDGAITGHVHADGKHDHATMLPKRQLPFEPPEQENIRLREEN